MTSAAGTPVLGQRPAQRGPQLGKPGERPGVTLADGFEISGRKLGRAAQGGRGRS